MAAEAFDLGKALLDTALGLIPPLAVGGVFYIIMRSILRADSKERKVYAEIEAEERAKRAVQGAKAATSSKPASKTK